MDKIIIQTHSEQIGNYEHTFYVVVGDKRSYKHESTTLIKLIELLENKGFILRKNCFEKKDKKRVDIDN